MQGRILQLFDKSYVFLYTYLIVYLFFGHMLTPTWPSQDPSKQANIQNIKNPVHKKLMEDFLAKESLWERLSFEHLRNILPTTKNETPLSSISQKEISHWYATLDRLYGEKNMEQYMLLSQQFFALYSRDQIENVLWRQRFCVLLLWQWQYYIENWHSNPKCLSFLAWVLNGLLPYVDLMYQNSAMIWYYLCLKVSYVMERWQYQELLDNFVYRLDAKFLSSLSYDMQFFLIREQVVALEMLKRYDEALDVLTRTLNDSRLGNYIF